MTVLILQALLLAPIAGGAPVSLAEAPIPPPQPAVPAEIGRAAANRGGPTPSDLSRPDAMAARKATPAASAGSQAADSVPADEAHDAAAKSIRPKAASSGPQTGGKSAAAGAAVETADIDPDLKEAAKAAREWVREAVPWAQKSNASDAAPDPSQEAGTGADGSLAPNGARAGSTGPNAAGTADQRTSRGAAQAVQVNFVGEIIKVVKDVLAHPMAWLVIGLIATGSVAVSMTKRRANRRWGRRSAQPARVSVKRRRSR